MNPSSSPAPQKRNIIIILIIFSIILGFAIIGIIIKRQVPMEDENTISLAKCLTEKGYAMAGTAWCPHCTAQKEMFGEAFQYVTFHDCDIDVDWCKEQNITSYPTWLSPLGSHSLGTMTLNQLKTMSDC